ncbi:MAG: PIG-L family deacetylase [Acidobacteriaceae bacterium]
MRIRGPILSALLSIAFASSHPQQAQPPIPPPDARFKADVLVIVAHPDDDTGVSTFLAKAVLDQGKHAAVIFTNRGSSGPDAVSLARGKALADIREIEARKSLAARGITNVWFLDGRDTATQDVLHSLETMGHGQALDDMVRLIRLTRPDVIVTWLPAYVAGENHGDHQASAVVAVEAFDMAGNPADFPEQLTPPRDPHGISQYGEGLLPWQPKKLYFFSDASHQDFLKGHGPAYLASEISPSRKVPYSEINRLGWEQDATQIDFSQQVLNYFLDMPEYLILGKSLVPASVNGDVFAGITDQPIPYHPNPPYTEPRRAGISLALGGPWAFYREFYRAHSLTSLEKLVPPQSALSSDRRLWVPLLLRNDTAADADITLHPALPPGWTGNIQDLLYHLKPGETYPIQLFYEAPGENYKAPPQTLTWTALDHGSVAGKVTLSVYLEFDGVPQ